MIHFKSELHPGGQPNPSSTANVFWQPELAESCDDKDRDVELLFDSLLQSCYRGVRGADDAGIRRMLYRADSLQIDLQIEAKPDCEYLLVSGQVLDLRRSEIMSGGVSATLSNRRGNLVHVLTNEFGEFHVQIQKSGDLELALLNVPEQRIVISLKDPVPNPLKNNKQASK